MPSVLPHLLVPVLLGIAFLPVARKRLLLWAPLALVPDLDYFFAKEYHRALLSNIWIPLALAATLFVLWRVRDPTSRLGEYMWRPGAPGNVALSTYYIGGHLLMDVFAGGVSLLWPLTPRNFYLFFNIVVDTETNQPVVTGEGGTEPDIVTVSPQFEWWSTIDSAMATLTAVTLLVWLAWRWWGRRGVVQPVVVRRAAVEAPSHKE